MTLRGHVKNGQIMLDEPVALPEGADVKIEIAVADSKADSARRLTALEAFAAGMDRLTQHLPPGHVVDDSREKIYEGRGG